MKKSYLFLTLATLLELTSCTGHFSKQLDNMITIDGKTISLNDVYAAYGGTSKSASALYDVVNNIYIQMAEPRTASMEAAVNAKYKTDYEEKAESNATSNKTSVKEEKEKLLESAGVDTEEQYRNKLYLDQQKSNLDDRFKDEEFISADASDKNGDYAAYFNSNSSLTASSPLDQYIGENYPYHMRHILVKVDGSDKFRSEVTEDQAKKLSEIVQQLGVSGSDDDGYSNNLSYGQIALEKSDDTGSASNYGDTGLMNKIGGTTLVNEFRFGTYAWDMLFDTSSTVNKNAQDGLLPSSNTTDGSMARSLLNNGTDSIDYDVYGSSYLETLVMGKMSDATSAFDNRVEVVNGNSKNYPRNILFSNNYNYHGLGLIYVENPTSLGSSADEQAQSLVDKYNISLDDAKDVVEQLTLAYNNSNNKSLSDASLAKVNGKIKVLKETVKNGVPSVSPVTLTENDCKIVFDDKTKTGVGTSTPILVTRVSSSYEGVHFMSVIKNPFTSTDMRDYLTLDVNTATERDDSGKFKTHNYINYIDYGTNATSSYNSRKDKIIDDNISSRDSNTTYAKNEYIKNKALADGHTVKLSDANDALVKKYVEEAIASNNISSQETYDSAWLSYVKGLRYQIENYDNEFFGTLGYSSIYSFNKAIIGKYIVAKSDAFDTATRQLKNGVYEVRLENYDASNESTFYYTTNDVTLATGYASGNITLNPEYITSSGTSGGSSSSTDSSSDDSSSD